MPERISPVPPVREPAERPPQPPEQKPPRKEPAREPIKETPPGKDGDPANPPIEKPRKGYGT